MGHKGKAILEILHEAGPDRHCRDDAQQKQDGGNPEGAPSGGMYFGHESGRLISASDLAGVWGMQAWIGSRGRSDVSDNFRVIPRKNRRQFGGVSAQTGPKNVALRIAARAILCLA